MKGNKLGHISVGMTVTVPVSAGGPGAEVEAEEAGAGGRGPRHAHAGGGAAPRPGEPRGRLPRQRQVVGLLVGRGVNEISRTFLRYLEAFPC